MNDKTKIIKKDISYAIRKTKNIAKKLAKQHNTRGFIDIVSKQQQMVTSLFIDLFVENIEEYHKIGYKQTKFDDEINLLWRYCQGENIFL